MRALRKIVQLPMTRPSLVGGVLALLVGAGAFFYLGDTDSSPTTAVGIERVAVLVATEDLTIRGRVGAEQVELRQLPVEAVHPRALRDAALAIGKFATTNITAGEQILVTDVSEAPRGSSLARLIPVGKRAIAISVSNVATAGGLVTTGDRVDLIAVFEEDVAGSDSTVIVATDIEVLAISQTLLGEGDTTIGETNGGSPNAAGATITIAVSLLDAQRITLADQFGSIVLFLRNPDDSETPVTSPVELDSVARR